MYFLKFNSSQEMGFGMCEVQKVKTHTFCECPLEIVAPSHRSRHNASFNRWLGEKAAKRPCMNNKCACWGRESKWPMLKLFSILRLLACGKGTGESVDLFTKAKWPSSSHDYRKADWATECSQCGIRSACGSSVLMWKSLLLFNSTFYLVFIHTSWSMSVNVHR